jgi:hypothetical protein
MAIQNSCIYPDNENGCQQYTRDMAAWEATWGANVEMSFRRENLPLTLGTAALGSHKCYGCEKEGYMSKDCPIPEDECINPHECAWCAYITKILFTIGNHGTPTLCQQIPIVVQISIGENEVIEYDPYLYLIYTVSFHEVGQGNGLESHE